MPILSAIWKFLGLWGCIALAAGAFAGWQTLHLHWVEGSLSAAKTSASRYESAFVKAQLGIAALKQANNAQTVQLAQFAADAKENKKIVASYAEVNHQLAVKYWQVSRDYEASGKGSHCYGTTIQPHIVSAICPGTACHAH